jgi:WD repeat-containing protein 55
LPSSYPSSHSTILTGSSDGLLRAVQLLPTKLIGVIADHGEFPIERIAIDLGGEGRWVGSAGHEDILRMTDLKEVFEDESKDDEKGEEWEQETKGDVDPEKSVYGGQGDVGRNKGPEAEEDGGSGASDVEPSEAPQQKRKRKKEKDPLAGKRKRGRNQVDAEPSFFSEL